jgi:outer membrane porin, OprD family
MTGICYRKGLAAALLMTVQVVCAAPEYIQSEQTAPGSVYDSEESSEYAFKPFRPARVVPYLGEAFREGTLDLQLRNYYFHREHEDNPDSETWAQGGSLGYKTPWWQNRLRIGSTLYGSLKLYGPADQGGSKLLKPVQQSFGVLGEAYLEARLYRNLTFKAYRQKYTLPYLNGNDSRMVPNTFESAALYDSSGEHFVYGLAHTWRIKERDATSFVSMTEAAGIDGTDRGVTTAVGRYTLANAANLAVVNHYGKDFMNILYTEVNSRARTVKDLGLQLSAQFTRQNSVGDELGGDFDTHSWGAKLGVSYNSLLLNLAHTSTSSNAGIQSYWGGKPSYLSLMLRDFDRADEHAWLVGLSSDFRYFGEHGFSGFINYARGDTPDQGSNASPDQSEFDITLDYKPVADTFKGLWFRLRGAILDQDGAGGEDLKEIRFIINYDFPIF